MQYHVRRKKCYVLQAAWAGVRSKWLAIGQDLFYVLIGPRRSQGQYKRKKEKRPLSFSLFSPNKLGNKEFIICLVCVASVSVRFRSKEPGAGVKDRAKNVSLLLRNRTETLATQAIICPKRKLFFLRDQSGKSQASCSIANQNAIFTLSCPLTDSGILIKSYKIQPGTKKWKNL